MYLKQSIMRRIEEGGKKAQRYVTYPMLGKHQVVAARHMGYREERSIRGVFGCIFN